MEGLSAHFGAPGDSVYHATIPFQFREHGGAADVVPFPNHVSGMTYITSELTGEDVGHLEGSLGHYELAVCTRDDLSKAADFISRLACYTCDAILEPGQTMDIGEFFGDSTIRAVVFTTFSESKAHFKLREETCGVLLCIGITSDELEVARSQGSEKVLQDLKEKDVFPYTIPNRPSVYDSGKKSFFSRMFKK